MKSFVTFIVVAVCSLLLAADVTAKVVRIKLEANSTYRFLFSVFSFE